MYIKSTLTAESLYREAPGWTLQGRIPPLCQYLLMDCCWAGSDFWWHPWRLISKPVLLLLFIYFLCGVLHLLNILFFSAVLGTAFAFNILFKIPVWVGVILTVFSTFLLLGVQRFGVYKQKCLLENFSAKISQLSTQLPYRVGWY
jgi:hypothetical protein